VSVADALAAGAAAFALDCARLFSDRPEVVANALHALRVLEPHTHAREWPGMPDMLLAALAAHPQHALLVVHATQLLLYAAAGDAALTSLVLERAGVVTAALVAQGDDDRASFCCIALLDWAALRGVGKDGSTKALRHAMMTPAVVRATLRVLNVGVGDKTRVDACACLLRYTPPSSVDALPGVATALLGAINARPVEALAAVSVVFRSITDHTWDVSKMIGAELRAAGGLLPLTRALRACVAARGESDKLEADTAKELYNLGAAEPRQCGGAAVAAQPQRPPR
jgi:hypothetical protein